MKSAGALASAFCVSGLPRATVARPRGSKGRLEGTLTMKSMARATGLEPATSGVTGRHSNQLSYARAFRASAATVRVV